jgi:hypothetical protein
MRSPVLVAHATFPSHESMSCLQDARWRRGETVSQKTARDQMISLEAVASSQLAFQPRG